MRCKLLVRASRRGSEPPRRCLGSVFGRSGVSRDRSGAPPGASWGVPGRPGSVPGAPPIVPAASRDGPGTPRSTPGASRSDFPMILGRSGGSREHLRAMIFRWSPPLSCICGRPRPSAVRRQNEKQNAHVSRPSCALLLQLGRTTSALRPTTCDLTMNTLRQGKIT